MISWALNPIQCPLNTYSTCAQLLSPSQPLQISEHQASALGGLGVFPWNARGKTSNGKKAFVAQTQCSAALYDIVISLTWISARKISQVLWTCCNGPQMCVYPRTHFQTLSHSKLQNSLAAISKIKWKTNYNLSPFSIRLTTLSSVDMSVN